MGQPISTKQTFEKILSKVETRPRDAPFLIGVNGIDGAGKTVFSDDLSRFLLDQGRPVQVVHVDDFHNSKKIRYEGNDEAQNYYYRSIDFKRLTRDLLEPIVNDRELDAELVLLDLCVDEYTNVQHYVVNRDTIVIVEGVFIFSKELSRYFDLRVFLDITFDESVRRAIARDKHTPADRIKQRYAEKYHAGQRLYLSLDDPKGAADLIINNEDYLNPFEVS
jgi:uridine kinase